mgnify:CR=1 FL=1
MKSMFHLNFDRDSFKTNELTVYTSGLGGLFKPGIPVGKIYKDNFVHLISLKMINLYQALMLMQYQMQQLVNNILTMQKNPSDIKDMLLNIEEPHLW